MPSISNLGTRRFVSRSGARSAAFNHLPDSPEAIAATSYNLMPNVTRTLRIPYAMTDAEIALLPWVDPDGEPDEPAPTTRDVRIFVKPVCNRTLGVRSNLGRITRTPKGLGNRELKPTEILGADFDFPELHSLLGEGQTGYTARFIKLGVRIKIANPTPAMTGRWSVCISNGRKLVFSQFFENRMNEARTAQEAMGKVQEYDIRRTL